MTKRIVENALECILRVYFSQRNREEGPGREEVNSQMLEAGVTPNTKMATAVSTAQD